MRKAPEEQTSGAIFVNRTLLLTNSVDSSVDKKLTYYSYK
jgi:hypothetical protein